MRRVVVTGLERSSFDEGLALVAAVQARSAGLYERIVVLDLGLGPGQVERLLMLEGVAVWPQDDTTEALRARGGDEARLVALRLVAGRWGEGVAALWIDAETLPEGSLEGAFTAVEKGGILWSLCRAGEGSGEVKLGIRERAARQVERLVTLLGSDPGAGGRGFVLGVVSGRGEASPGWRRTGARNALGVFRWKEGPFGPEPIRDPVARAKTKVLGRLPSTARPLAKAWWRALVPREVEERWLERGRRWKSRLGSSTPRLSFEKGRPSVAFAPVSTFRFPVGPEAPWDGLRFGLRRREALFVVGSGPSLKGVDLSRLAGLDTIGMNASYRHWDRIGWHPSYYACLDTVVLESHKGEIRELVRCRREKGTRLFFLREGILESFPELAEDPAVFFLDPLRARLALFDSGPITTGSHSALFGMMLGYRRIYLMGIDCNYVEEVQGSERRDGAVLEMVTQPEHNPNYFIDDYQRVGDRYHLPNPVPELHIAAWEVVRQHGARLQCEIFQTSSSSRLQIFPACDLDAAIARERGSHE